MNPNKSKVYEMTGQIHTAEMALELVGDFCYINSYISYSGSCEKNGKVRIGKATTVLEKWKKKIWKND